MNKNEPAFPIVCPVDFQFAHNGLTKREHFAGLAMQGNISNQEWLMALAKAASEVGDSLEKTTAKASIEFADALLEALND